MFLTIAFVQFTLAGEHFFWGGISKIDITQKQVDNVIKEYVDKNMPQEVKRYEEFLRMQTQQKLEKYSDKTFVLGDLMWQDTEANRTKKLNMIQFNLYCRDLDLADRKDWRTPTFYELLELVDYQKTNPSSVEGLRYINAEYYWSGSIDGRKKDSYWYVDFQKGMTDNTSSLKKLYIRCVRDLSTKRGGY